MYILKKKANAYHPKVTIIPWLEKFICNQVKKNELVMAHVYVFAYVFTFLSFFHLVFLKVIFHEKKLGAFYHL